MRRWTAYASALVAVVAVLAPAVSARDSFPLSNYPMFSHGRPRIVHIDTAVGIDTEGRRVRLSPSEIAGGVEVIRAGATVSKSIARGDVGDLCREITTRVDRAGVTSIQVVTERHDAVEWFRGAKQPLGLVVHASCERGP
jgi:hypothetical protein